MRSMIRRAKKEDCPALYDLLLEIFQDMELPVLEMVPPSDLKRLFVESMEEEESRYSYRNGLVYEENGEVAGCCFGYKGELEEVLSEPIQAKLAAYGLAPEIAFYPDRETEEGEWYLDSLITHPSHRRKGIAKKLIQALPPFVKEQGETVIGLNCEQDNKRARALYEQLGFVRVGDRVLAGHPYDHMQKRI